MGWFDNQIRERKQIDQELFENSILHMASAVVGTETADRMASEHIVTKQAIDDVLKYYRLAPIEIPSKITDPEEHRKWTGQDNRLIRENLKMLYREGAEIILRCPVIPGVNDTPEHFRGIAELTKEFPQIRQADLSPQAMNKRCSRSEPIKTHPR